MLESLFDIEIYDATREYTKVKLESYDKHIYNIYTIIRNILGSYSDINPIEFITTSQFPTILQNEIKTIASLYGSTNCKPLIFYPNYEDLYKAYNKNKKNIETVTFKQHMAVRDFLKKYDKDVGIDVCNDKKSYKFPKELVSAKTLVTTHIGLDLFNHGDFKLLESHTGALKSRIEFPTKYRKYGQHDMSQYPWMEVLYFLLGDHVFVKTADLRTKNKVLAIFSQYKVNLKTDPARLAITLRQDTLVGQMLYGFFDQYTKFL